RKRGHRAGRRQLQGPADPLRHAVRLSQLRMIMRSFAALVLACLAGAAAAQLRLPGVQPEAPGLAKPADAPTRQQLLDRIVAVVNTEVITQRDLAERIALIEAQLRPQAPPPPPHPVL